MDKILADKLIPDDCGVSIEYYIPQTNKRVDFIITGQNELNEAHAIIIELKQWSEALLTDKDAIVKTVINRRLDERTHPSYQVWSYAMLLQGFNQTIYEEKFS